MRLIPNAVEIWSVVGGGGGGGAAVVVVVVGDYADEADDAWALSFAVEKRGQGKLNNRGKHGSGSVSGNCDPPLQPPLEMLLGPSAGDD